MRHDPLRPVVPALNHWLCALRLDRGRVPGISRQVWLRNQGVDQQSPPRRPTQAFWPTPPVNEKSRLDFEAGLELPDRNGFEL